MQKNSKLGKAMHQRIMINWMKADCGCRVYKHKEDEKYEIEISKDCLLHQDKNNPPNGFRCKSCGFDCCTTDRISLDKKLCIDCQIKHHD